MAQSLPAMASVGNLVRNWSDWVGKFFNAYIAPLNQCAGELLKQFGNANDEFVEYVRLIHDLTGKILSRVGSTAGSAPTTCSIERFLEYAVNSSAGHNPFMFFAWSIRTTTPIHFRAYYGDPSNYAEVLNRLGYAKLQNAPQPANSCPGCDLNEYVLYGYQNWIIKGGVKYIVGYNTEEIYLKFDEGTKDKFIENIRSASSLGLGELLTGLNETIWSMININWLSSLYQYQQGTIRRPLKDVLIDYAMKVNESIMRISNQYESHYICRELPTFCVGVTTMLFNDYKILRESLLTLFNVFNKRGAYATRVYLVNNNACEGQAIGRHEYSLSNKDMSWCSYMDMVIPQVMLGRLELVNIDMNSLRSELGNRLSILSQDQFIGAYTVLTRWS